MADERKKDMKLMNTLLLDMDGVLYDTETIKTTLRQELQRTLNRLNRKFIDADKICQIGYDILKLDGNCKKIIKGDSHYSIPDNLDFGELYPDAFKDVLPQLASTYQRFMNETLFSEERRKKFFVPCSGVIDSLEHLAHEGYIMGLISNGDSNIQRRKAEALGIANYFDFIQVSGDPRVATRKPSMEFYDTALEKANSVGVKRTHPLEVREQTSVIAEDRETCFPEKENRYLRIKIGYSPLRGNHAQTNYKVLSTFAELPAFLLEKKIQAHVKEDDEIDLTRHVDIATKGHREWAIRQR